MIGNGYLQLVELTPGAQAWLGQTNGNFNTIDEEQPFIRRATAGEPIAINDAVAFGADGKLYKADSNGANYRFNMVGLARNSGNADEIVYFRTMGEAAFSHTLTPGQPLFLSETPGQLTHLAPAAARLVALALPSNRIFLMPSRSWAAS